MNVLNTQVNASALIDGSSTQSQISSIVASADQLVVAKSFRSNSSFGYSAPTGLTDIMMWIQDTADGNRGDAILKRTADDNYDYLSVIVPIPGQCIRISLTFGTVDQASACGTALGTGFAMVFGVGLGSTKISFECDSTTAAASGLQVSLKATVSRVYAEKAVEYNRFCGYELLLAGANDYYSIADFNSNVSIDY